MTTPRSTARLTAALGTTFLLIATAFAAPPHVRCVLWQGQVGRPHDTWSGKDAILKAVVSDPDGAENLSGASYEWDFGDGSAKATGTIAGPGPIEVAHTYTGSVGTPYVARLTIRDTTGQSASDTYPVTIRGKNLTAEINVAIDDGLWFLCKTQDRSGTETHGQWASLGIYVSETASAVHAFEINGHRPDGDATEDPYVDSVRDGLAHLLGRLETIALDLQHDDNPDANGNGIGIQTAEGEGLCPYQGGMIMDALIASGEPSRIAAAGPNGVAGRTYKAIVQDMCDAYAWGQCDDPAVGGAWRYGWNEWGDNSASQWAAIGMIPAEREWDCTIPPWVKTWNNIWLDYSFSQVDRWFGYQDPSAGNNDSQATRPSGMVQLFLAGKTTSDPRWIRTEAWFANAANWERFLSERSMYSWYAFAKAMRVAVPQPVVTLSNGFNWYEGSDAAEATWGMARKLVEDQDRGPGATPTRGVWPDLAQSTHPGAYGATFMTSWAIVILKPALFTLSPYAVARATPNPAGPGYTVSFDGSLSGHNDPARTIVTYQWDFDASNGIDWTRPDATGKVAARAYAAIGTYRATLRIVDDSAPSLSATDIVDVKVEPPPHDPTAVPGGPYKACPGKPATLDGSGSFDIDATDPAYNDAIVSWGWELDGIAPFDFDDASGATVEHSWGAAGTYNIGLRVTDKFGRTNAAWTMVQVAVAHCGTGAGFRRGDTNQDGRVDIADAIGGLCCLFTSEQGCNRCDCRDVLDGNDDGKLDIGDPIYLLNYLFASGPILKPPFVSCGQDPTVDPLDCQFFDPSACP